METKIEEKHDGESCQGSSLGFVFKVIHLKQFS